MTLNETTGFSLVNGGVTHQIFQKLGRCERPEQLFRRTAVACALISWLPLLILSVAENVAWGDKVSIPFLYDFAAYTRFLIAVPMLVMAESLIGPRLAEVAAHFIGSGRIAEENYPAYAEAVDEAVRLRDSKLGEGIVLIITLASSVTAVLTLVPTVSNWRWMTSDTGVTQTFAAWWYVIISIPVFQFLLYRWFFRMFIWSRFLYRMSRLDLKLMPTHPDRVGGIAFVGTNQRFFAIITFALGATFAGIYANEIIYENISIYTIRIPMALLAFLLVFLIQLPGLFFFVMLRKAKRRGVFTYGTLALRYTSEFQEKWIDGKHPADEQLIGSSDIQSLADMGNSYSVIHDMRIVPFELRSTIWLAAAFSLPLFPLLLTVMPLNEILQTIVKLLA